MPTPPSTASSSSSSTSSLVVPPARTGSTRHPPLQPPQPLFYIDRPGPPSSDAIDEVRRDPFRSPDSSIPPTPRSAGSNPFSPPASVINLSSEQHVTIAPFTHERMHSRSHSSRVSVQSSLRNSTTELSPRETRPTTMRNNSSQIRDSFMSPPILSRRATVFESNAASRLSIVGPKSKRTRSTMLTGEIAKPWITDKDTPARLAYWITYGVALLGLIGGALQCYFEWKNIPRVGNLCLIMEDNFEKFDTEYTWEREVDLSGFGNGEFEMTTNSDNNSFVKDGKLYLVPTLTSDIIGQDAIFNGYTYNISGCTNANISACGAVSNVTAGTVIPPVMSARINTRNSHHIQFGKVEIVAKLPTGDWLWPALWMLPVDSDYGPWPLSGEIDIMESRGNGPEYKAQGIDFVRGSLNWGPFTWLNGVSKTFGWWTNRRKRFDQGFHTYSVEWTPNFIRIYVDSRLHNMLNLKFNEPFFQRGNFPPFVANGSQTILTPNPWQNGTNASPFDKPFYLIMNVAVGGTNGWFPDGVGDKPWLDRSFTAMRDFAKQQATWYTTWPQNIEDRAMVVESVKMWQSC